MGRVLLISFAGYPCTPSSLMPDNGLACLAGGLAGARHDVRVLDFGTVDTIRRLFPERLGRRVKPLAEQLFMQGGRLSLLNRIRFLNAGRQLARHQSAEIQRMSLEIARQAESFKPDVVGLKLWNGDGFSGSIQIARAIRERIPRVRIIGGGPHVDYFGRHILDYTDAFDLLVHGEGEIALPAIVDAMVNGRDWQALPGVIYRTAEGIQRNPAETIADLDALPLPVYSSDIYPALSGDQKIHIGVLDESRGCPNRCSFCIHPSKSGGKWTFKSPERVIAEMKRLMAQLNTRYLIYSGSNTSARAAVGIAEEIVKQGVNVTYGCFGHVQGIARADFDLLRRSGCRAIFYGLESGSKDLLSRAFNKPLNLETAERVIRDTKEAGICAITSVIYPAPFENAQTTEETLSFLRRVRPDSVPVTPPGMIPGTDWERKSRDYGFEKSRRKDAWRYALTYKIKLLFPPSLWKPLPYTLNGKSSRKFLGECERFIAQLEREGIMTDLSHELVLMAEALGERGDLRAFRNKCRTLFFSGDVDGIARMVTSLNGATKC